MANVNKVILIGNLTRDPELRYTPSGAAVCEFTLALNRNWMSKQGEKRDETCFIDVVCWARTAENCAEYLKKGRQTYVEGRLTQDRWESQDGQKRSKIRVTAERVQFLGGGRGAAGGAGAGVGAGDMEAEMPPMDAGPGEDVPF